MPLYSRSRSSRPYSIQRRDNYSSPRSSFQSGLFGLGSSGSTGAVNPYSQYLSNVRTRPTLGMPPARQRNPVSTMPIQSQAPTAQASQVAPAATLEPMTAQAPYKPPQEYAPPTNSVGLAPSEMPRMPQPDMSIMPVQATPQTYNAPQPDGMMYAGGTPYFNERGTTQPSAPSDMMYAGGTPNFNEGRPQALGNALAVKSPQTPQKTGV